MQFIDLHAQQKRLKADIDLGIAEVLKSGRYILGPQVQEFEAKLAAFGEAKHAVGCANGTDAISLPLMAWGIGPGDAVFCPSFTYCATAEVIALLGATPVFIDIDRETYNMCADSLGLAISEIRAKGELVPKAVITVDLFGQSADYEKITPIVRENNLHFISDSAQGFGTTLNGKHPLAWADVQTTSFFPAKPLGCYGDGGATLTNDNEIFDILTSLRVHGKGVDKYDNVRVGMNSRLDTLQAAILLPKLAVFGDEINKRNVVAANYTKALKGVADRVPEVLDGVVSTWAQYTIEVPDPFAFAASLKEQGIPTARYYPKPVHVQSAYSNYPVSNGALPNTMACIDHIISLPMHPYLTDEDQGKVIEAAKAALA
jgi:dTDP-4-amino-4,6-dideoxygalactose transaminase